MRLLDKVIASTFLSVFLTVLISGGLISYTRLGVLRPDLISPASLILLTSFSKYSFFISPTVFYFPFQRIADRKSELRSNALRDDSLIF